LSLPSGRRPFAFFAATLGEPRKNEANHRNEPEGAVALRITPGEGSYADIEVINSNAPWWHNVVVIRQ